MTPSGTASVLPPAAAPVWHLPTAPDAAAFYERPDVPAVLAAAYGEEEAGKMLGEWLSCVNNYDTENYTIRADMSYIPAMCAHEGESEMMEGKTEGE